MVDTPCVEWTGHRNRGGYGGRRYRGRMQLAHRIAWMEAHGDIPPGMKILHLCDNPPCVRLDHLQLGTQIENIADMVAKGRQWRPTHCRRNHEFTPENTATRPTGGRKCRTCLRENAAAARRRDPERARQVSRDSARRRYQRKTSLPDNLE